MIDGLNTFVSSPPFSTTESSDLFKIAVLLPQFEVAQPNE